MKKSISEKNPLLGVIGGMGTQATAYFYERLHSLLDVKTEQEYPNVLLYSIPSTPDRTAFITGQSLDSPLESLIDAAKTLESAGASCIAIPCVTSHFFYTELVDSVNIPVLNMLEETAKVLKNNEVRKVRLLATDGTIRGNAFFSTLKKFGIDVSPLSEELQSEVMKMIYDIKRGVAVSACDLDVIIDKALENGTENVILGCTELCILGVERPNTVNTLDVLAKAALNMIY